MNELNVGMGGFFVDAAVAQFYLVLCKDCRSSLTSFSKSKIMFFIEQRVEDVKPKAKRWTRGFPVNLPAAHL